MLSFIKQIVSFIFIGLLSGSAYATQQAYVPSKVHVEVVATKNGKPLAHYCSDEVSSEAPATEIYVDSWAQNGNCAAGGHAPFNQVGDGVHRIRLDGIRQDMRYAAFEQFVQKGSGSYELRYEQSPKYKSETTRVVDSWKFDFSNMRQIPGSDHKDKYTATEWNVPSSAVTIVDKRTGKQMPLNDFIDDLMLKQGTYYSGFVGGTLLGFDMLTGHVRSATDSRASDARSKIVSAPASSGASSHGGVSAGRPDR